jgi:cell division protein FtsN
MARDYKRSGKRKRRSSPGQQNGWLWLSGGLVAGAIIGYLGYLIQAQGGLSPAPQQARTVAAAPAAPPPKPAAKPAPPPAEAAPAKNRFEFYTLLPEMEMQVGEEHFGDAPGAASPPKKSDEGPYILQVGSFRHAEEADSLKARLALLGIEATIQTVVIRDSDVWYRVRVGPYDSLRALGQVRSRLQRNDIDFMVLRLGA